jgi:hypothetical protein
MLVTPWHTTHEQYQDYLGEYPENNFLHKYVVDMILMAIPPKDMPDVEETFPVDLFKHVFVGKIACRRSGRLHVCLCVARWLSLLSPLQTAI